MAILHAKDDGIWPVLQTENILWSEVEAVEGLIIQRYPRLGLIFHLSVISTHKCPVDHGGNSAQSLCRNDRMDIVSQEKGLQGPSKYVRRARGRTPWHLYLYSSRYRGLWRLHAHMA